MRSYPRSRILAGLFFLFLVPYVTSAFAKPTIDWSPRPLSISVAAGTATAASVEMSVGRDLTDVDLSVVPELAPFVSVFPETLYTVVAGTPQTVSLWVSVPADTPLGTYDGTLHVKDGKKTIAEPLPIVLHVSGNTSDTIPEDVALPSSDRVTLDPVSGNSLVKDELIVTVEVGTPIDEVIAVIESFGGVFLGSIPELNSYQVQISGSSVNDLYLMREQMESTSIVDHVSFHWLMDPLTLPDLPDDPAYDDGMAPGSQELIELPLAWDITTGSPCQEGSPVSVAVIDTGFYLAHEDLGNVISGGGGSWINTVWPLNAHGTGVAGVIGATANNDKGVAGVLWQGCITVYSAGWLDVSEALDGIRATVKVDDEKARQQAIEAIKNGARVVNYSVGVTAPTEENAKKNSQPWADVIKEARLTEQGALFVFPADNQQVDVKFTSPANLVLDPQWQDDVIAVVGVETDGSLWNSSGFGQGITIAAPGTNIETTYTDIFGGYYEEEAYGNSLATPFVTGVAGLMLSKNPDLTPPDLKRLIEEGAERGGLRVPPPDDIPSDYVLDAYVLNACESVRLAMKENGTFPPDAFVDGDIVKVTDDIVDVYADPNGVWEGLQSRGATGELVGGPRCAGRSWWWEVDFGDVGPSGWVAEEFLEKVTESPVDGECGTVATDEVCSTALTQSSSGLCSQGTVSAFGEDGDGSGWSWLCVADGVDASCAEDACVEPPVQPTASLTADPTSIVSGTSSTLSWSSTNAESCEGEGGGFDTGGSTSGTESVSPIVTSTYSVTCIGPGGTSDPAGATVTVTAAPPVGTFSIDPASATVGEGAGSVGFTVTRSDGTAAQTVYVSTVQNQGTANTEDYVDQLDESILFPVGETQRTVTVLITDDSEAEGSETFGLIVQDASTDPMEVFLAFGTFTILDDDGGIGATRPLNDTGITLCGDATRNDLPCPHEGFPGQDAEFGRDVTDNDPADGHAGFSFTKLDPDGNALPESAAEWSCVQDNVTGMVWEEKTDDGGLRDKDWVYTWYNPDPSANGGTPGVQNGGFCSGSPCDTDGYVQAVNAQGLCGATDWRLPDPGELMSIGSNDRHTPAMDTEWFSNVRVLVFWTSSSFAGVSAVPDYAWAVDFFDGLIGYFGKGDVPVAVRLVRGGQ